MHRTLAPVRRTTAHRTVIALHCSGAGGRVFESYRALMSADTELIAPDLLGSGAETTWPLGAPVTIDTEAERLAPLLARGRDGVI
jgi:surfactin synthase thioesterase subunit